MWRVTPSRHYHPCFVELDEQPEKWLKNPLHRRFDRNFLIGQVKWNVWKRTNQPRSYKVVYYSFDYKKRVHFFLKKFATVVYSLSMFISPAQEDKIVDSV